MDGWVGLLRAQQATRFLFLDTLFCFLGTRLCFPCTHHVLWSRQDTNPTYLSSGHEPLCRYETMDEWVGLLRAQQATVKPQFRTPYL